MKKPIVAVDGRLMYYRRAGISQYTRGLVVGLSTLNARGFEVRVFLDRRDRDREWVPDGVRVWDALMPAHHRLEPVAWPLELAARFPGLAVLHATDFIAPRGRFRKVITIHDLYFMANPQVMGADGRRYYAGTPASAARADRIIAVSAFTASEIARYLGPAATAKTVVVAEAGAIPVRAARAPNDDEPYLLFVGTFEPRKNLATLLKALAQPEAAGSRLVIVGEPGWGDSEPARLAEGLGVRDRVRFAGRIDDNALDALYARARALVSPSLSEGFGLPALEAMARGVPVVCAATGALPELVNDAALLHDPLDTAGLAAQLGAVWTDAALRADLARRGLARAAHFSWARAARETMAVYADAMAMP